eukprot:751143-Hanusia_phi.AAC.1
MKFSSAPVSSSPASLSQELATTVHAAEPMHRRITFPTSRTSLLPDDGRRLNSARCCSSPSGTYYDSKMIL